MECGAEGRLRDGLDREELIRKREVFRIVLTSGVSSVEGRKGQERVLGIRGRCRPLQRRPGA